MSKIKAIPKTGGACADRLYGIAQEKALLQRQIDALDEERRRVEVVLNAELTGVQATGIRGKVAKVTVLISQVPVVEKWDALYAHIQKTGNFEFLQRRVSAPAIREIWDDGEEVPGVAAISLQKLSVTKL